MNEYAEHLLTLKDEKYREFNVKLITSTNEERIIGVRVPLIRKYAGELIKNGKYSDFISSLPHTYYEEDILHICIVSAIKDYDEAMRLTEEFLPYIDNWAVCDSFSPKAFGKNKEKLYEKIKEWMNTGRTYFVRFAIVMLMKHFLGDDFLPEHLTAVSNACGDDYYVKMAKAWYFATALAFHYDDTVKLLEGKALDEWVHNKTIRKAVESYRISDDKKAYLKSLRVERCEPK